MRARIVIAASFAAGCPGPAAGPDAGASGDCGLEVELEVLAPSREFVPAAAVTHAELILGFQGFRYVYLRGRITAPPPIAVATVITQLDGDTARAQSPGQLELTPDGDGGHFSQPLAVFFNDDALPSLVDRGCAFTLRVTEPGGGTCWASAGGHAILAYDPSCYEGPGGERVCGDAGVPDATDGGL